MSNLAKLRNLGPKSASWLEACGVRDASQLGALGAAGAYALLKKNGYPVNLVFAYAVEGALLDMHWNALPRELKARLKRQCAQALKELEAS